MKRKFIGIVAIAFAVVVGQSNFSEACHRHRKARSNRTSAVVQTPYCGYESAAVNAYSNHSACGCGTSVFGSDYNGSYSSGYATSGVPYNGAAQVNQSVNAQGYQSGYAPSYSSGADARVNGNVPANSAVPTADVIANTGVGR
jgi:hypothetical protein